MRCYYVNYLLTAKVRLTWAECSSISFYFFLTLLVLGSEPSAQLSSEFGCCVTMQFCPRFPFNCKAQYVKSESVWKPAPVTCNHHASFVRYRIWPLPFPLVEYI